MMLLQVDPESIPEALRALLISFVIAMPIAWNREVGRRNMGLRTFPLVAVASCSYVLIGITFAGGSPEALSRIVQGLITGVGFIGGGAILKSQEEVHGASTAAAIWATGAVGGAVAFERYELAISIATLTFLTFLLLTPVRDKIQEDKDDTD